MLAISRWNSQCGAAKVTFTVWSFTFSSFIGCFFGDRPVRLGITRLFVQHQVVPPEVNVVGGERLTIRPVDALAELKRHAHAIGGIFVFDGKIWLHFAGIGAPAVWAFIEKLIFVRAELRPFNDPGQLAAIGSHFFDGGNDHRFGRQRLSNGGNLPCFTNSAKAGASLDAGNGASCNGNCGGRRPWSLRAAVAAGVPGQQVQPGRLGACAAALGSSTRSRNQAGAAKHGDSEQFTTGQSWTCHFLS